MDSLETYHCPGRLGNNPSYAHASASASFYHLSSRRQHMQNSGRSVSTLLKAITSACPGPLHPS
jgi:hypothetical protein